ncbi:substrate-binding periplasmic protein [Undibacterium curvum]|uniref:substrate-binding periplasmic protein n=1 Tax=Undibacterium curvum TaxID=2762294 RepID=UPI003D1185AF
MSDSSPHPEAQLRRKLLRCGLAVAGSLAAAQLMAQTRLTLYIRENRNEAGQMLPLREEIRRLLDLFEQRLALQFEIERYPYTRLYEKTRNHEGIAFGVSAGRSHPNLILSEPFLSNQVWLVVRSDAVFPFRGIEDLRGKTVGVVRGSGYGDEFEVQRNKLFKVEEDVSSHTARLRKLINHRMDVMLFGDFHTRAEEVSQFLHQMIAAEKSSGLSPGEDFVVLDKPLLIDELCFAASPKYEDWIHRINTVIQTTRRNGELNRAIFPPRKAN